MTRRAPAVRGPAHPYAVQAINSLRSWPALSSTQHEGGITFTAEGHKVVRFNGHGTAYLHLTPPVIERLSNTLARTVHLGTDVEPGWVVIRIEDSVDLAALLALVSVAIKANTSGALDGSPIAGQGREGRTRLPAEADGQARERPRPQTETGTRAETEIRSNAGTDAGR
ncbi:luciferase family protein [Nonomuraea sp. B12E4]|uniref:luciferase domain-containing protein n=1 Tax=Nonomuraea sp. B12E4 TaxID=3153564 RepID=UPI00325E6FBB